VFGAGRACNHLDQLQARLSAALLEVQIEDRLAGRALALPGYLGESEVLNKSIWAKLF
jgi:hypothetical protein